MNKHHGLAVGITALLDIKLMALADIQSRVLVWLDARIKIFHKVVLGWRMIERMPIVQRRLVKSAGGTGLSLCA